ncbi:MAG: 4Fe-4S dicluster domain-containing protein [Fusobacterium sp.]
MIRTIIKIDAEKCNGCELCVKACHEGAIQMVNGKAKLMRDDYCDGLGDCLPGCPTNAISFEEREAEAYDEKAVLENQKKNANEKTFVCPGTLAKSLKKEEEKSITVDSPKPKSQLRQWPVQIKLVPVNAPYFQNSNLLIAADCTAYAYANFHNEFMKNKITIIGCPKLDMIDYSEKLTAIIKNNDIKSVTVVRMEVPCCGGIENASKIALKESGKFIPWQIVTISNDGKILND